jgi:hypothetical protein
MSCFGWNCKDDGDAESRLTTSIALWSTGVGKESLVVMNDCDLKFEQIANCLDIGLYKLV